MMMMMTMMPVVMVTTMIVMTMTMMMMPVVMAMIVMTMTLLDPKHSPAELKLAIIRTHVPELHVWAAHKKYLTNIKPKKTKKRYMNIKQIVKNETAFHR